MRKSDQCHFMIDSIQKGCDPENVNWLRPVRYLATRLGLCRPWRNKRKSVTEIVDGVKYHLDLGEVIDSTIYYSGVWEERTFSQCQKLIRSGDIVFDIGANCGFYTLKFAQMVQPSGHVYSFEPMSFSFRKLESNCALNPSLQKYVTIEKRGLAEVVGEKSLAFTHSWRLFPKGEQIESPELISFTTIDRYMAEKRIPQVDFLKIDVDGYEFKIISGAVETLKKFKPILCLELGTYTLERFGDHLESLLKFLESLGYWVYRENDMTRFESQSQIMKSIPRGQTINAFCFCKKMD